MVKNTFFISDLHIGHRSVVPFTHIQYDAAFNDPIEKTISLDGEHWFKRPYLPSDIIEWNEIIKLKWNSKVGKQDTTYILGDVTYIEKPHIVCEFLKELNGKKLIVSGNHDGQLLKFLNKNPVKGVECVGPYVDTYVSLPRGLPAKRVILSHYPIYSYDGCGFGVYHLHGHIHMNIDENVHYYKSMIEGFKFRKSKHKEYVGPKFINVGSMMPWMNFEPKDISELGEIIDKMM